MNQTLTTMIFWVSTLKIVFDIAAVRKTRQQLWKIDNKGINAVLANISQTIDDSGILICFMDNMIY